MSGLDAAAKAFRTTHAEFQAAGQEVEFYEARLAEARAHLLEAETSCISAGRTLRDAAIGEGEPDSSIGSVAPTEEQRSPNPPVPGSSPGRPATLSPCGEDCSHPACRSCRSLDESLKKTHRLASGIAEAIGLIRSGDVPGRACPTCGGVNAHFDACKLRMAQGALECAISEVAEA